MTEPKIKFYQLFIGTITGTGWPIDGHRLVLGIWDYSPNTYALMDWDDKDDDAVMRTIFQTAVEAGFEDKGSFEAFQKVWKDGEYEWPGAFHFDPENVVDVVKCDD